jgi:hypothetical protein
LAEDNLLVCEGLVSLVMAVEDLELIGRFGFRRGITG